MRRNEILEDIKRLSISLCADIRRNSTDDGEYLDTMVDKDTLELLEDSLTMLHECDYGVEQ